MKHLMKIENNFENKMIYKKVLNNLEIKIY